MSHAPLWRFVARGLAQACDPPAPRVGLSRRAVLKLGATAAAGWALGCGPRSSPAEPAPVVAIVGAGLAGLTCAWQLRRAGIVARIFDAQSRVGGRVLSSRGELGEGLVGELGGELVDASHATLRGLCHALDLPLVDDCDDPQPAATIVSIRGERYSSEQLAEAFTPVAEAIAREYARVGTFAVSHREPGPAAALDEQSLAQWLDAAGVSGWLRDVLDVATTTEFGLDPEQQSALTFVGMFAGVEPRCFDPTFETTQRFRVRGGNDTLATRLGEGLVADIELEHRLEAVRPASQRYSLSFRRDSRSIEVLADAVVLALPFTTLRDVELDVELPPAKRRAIAELGYGTNAKLLAGFRRRAWRLAATSGTALTDLPYQAVWDATRMQAGERGILVSFTGGRAGVAIGDGDAHAHALAFADAIDALFPGARAAHDGEVRSHWPSAVWARGSYSCYRPGQRVAFGGVEAEPVERLFFAGEHTAKMHVGFMEGACESGMRAADEVLAALARAPIDRPAAQPVRESCHAC